MENILFNNRSLKVIYFLLNLFSRSSSTFSFLLEYFVCLWFCCSTTLDEFLQAQMVIDGGAATLTTLKQNLKVQSWFSYHYQSINI